MQDAASRLRDEAELNFQLHGFRHNPERFIEEAASHCNAHYLDGGNIGGASVER
jgi:hypothetical protein